MADHRRGVKPSYLPTFVSALAGAVAGGAYKFESTTEMAQFFRKIAAELKANTGKAVVVAGSRQPAEVHAVVATINAAINAPVDYYGEGDDRLKPVLRTTAAAEEMGGADWKAHGEQLKEFAKAVTGAKTVVKGK